MINIEHGIVSRREAVDPGIARRLPVGSQLRILPNHACATGTQFSEYDVVSGAGAAQQWRRFDGW